MSSSSLDESQLRLLAGTVWDSAQLLVRSGRVFVTASSSDGATGSVLDDALYKTRVIVDRGQVITTCTCRIGAFCEHGFALALTWMRGTRRDRRVPTVTAAGPESAGFASEDELRAWAREHQVEYALEQSAALLAPHLSPQLRYEVLYVVPKMTIGQLACPSGTRFMNHPRALAEAARAYLEAEAEGVVEGLAEEANWPSRAPSAEVAPLWDPLVELRRAFRAHITPRSGRQLALGHWSFRPEKVQILWRDPDHGHQYEKVATLAFVNGTPVVSCTCSSKIAGTLLCRHGLALIDVTLAVLANPEQRALAIQATTELTRPGWSRVMDALDRAVTATVERSAAKVELWWQVGGEPLDVVAIVRKVSKRGTLTAGARTRADRLLLDHPDLDPRDREVAELVAQFHDGAGRRGLYPHRALAALVGHPRVRNATGEPVAVRRCALGLAARAAGDGMIRLEPEVDGRRIELAVLGALFDIYGHHRSEPMVLFEPGGCVMVTADARIRDLCAKLLAYGDLFPPDVHEPLLEAITKLDGQMPVSIPSELKGVEYPATPTVVVRARLVAAPGGPGDASTQLELEVLVRPAPGTPLFVPGEGRTDVLVMREGVRGYVRRRLAYEPTLVRERLAALPLDAAEEGPPSCFRLGSLDVALDVVAALQHPPAGLEAQWVDERPRLVRRTSAKGLRVEITRERDWFGIEGSLEVEDDRLELAVLLDAMRRDQRYVRVGTASWLELTDELRARLVPLADHTYAGRDGLALSLGAVPAIADLTDAGARVTTTPTWTLAADRLVAARELAPKPPTSLRKIMRPYQVEGHAWLTRIAAWGAGACLADDMGLGKTLQAIAVLVDRAARGPAIVIAPTSVTPNWVSELARFAPKLRAVLLTEQDDRVASLASLRTGDVLIVSYGLLIREIDRLAVLSFATLVADEAQALKNADTRRAKAARRIDAELRIALTGTPLENHLGELWSIFSIVFPGLLGSWEQFRTRFALPIERGEASSDDEIRLAAEHARASLARVLRPFLLRRTKSEVARELPARTEIEVAIEMSDEERELYEDARLAAVAQLTAKGQGVRDEQRRFQVLAELTRLRLLASHPRLFDTSSEVPSSKLQRLLEIVEELRAGGHRALVFSQFTKHLALVRDELDRAGVVSLYLDGETPTKERARRIAAFQAGEAELFLISLKAGGTGINLTAADYVIHLDPWWNPAVEDQASDRAHRIGQTKPVTVYRLITTGTVEQKILAMHGQKRRLVSAVLDGTGAAAKLSTADLLELLSPPRP